MRLLIKIGDFSGYVAHIADCNGKQLCKVAIKRSLWQLQERSGEHIIICYHCRRIYETVKDDTACGN